MGALTHNGEVLQSLPANASQINFNKTGTNLNSTQTEAAIKEVNTKVNTNTEDITQLKSGLISDNYTIGYTVKNMLSYPYSETTKTVNDVTFTAADDGKIAVNGTASARATFLIKDATSNFALPSGSYILTKGLVQPGFGITVEAYNGNSWVKLLAISAGADAANFTVDYVGYDRLVITAYVDNGIEVTNKTLLPMIRLSSVQDATWEAYRQTVAESLTNLIVMEEVELAFTGTVTLNTYSYITLENIAKAGYKIVSLQPRLVSPAEYLNINTMVVGSMDEQIIAKCNYANSTGSYTDPVFYLKIIYLKITN